jgi:hypothetical protein
MSAARTTIDTVLQRARSDRVDTPIRPEGLMLIPAPNLTNGPKRSRRQSAQGLQHQDLS